MIFSETDINGVWVINPERMNDERGFFARSYCRNEFEKRNLVAEFIQNNISFNRFKGTIRGMHFQKAPFEEVKIVRCTSGSIYDVVVDLRPDSPTFKKWIGVELNSKNRSMLYIPKGFAHGFQTLEDNSEIFYMMSQVYNAASATGVRFDDPAFEITWPLDEIIISERDCSFENFT